MIVASPDGDHGEVAELEVEEDGRVAGEVAAAWPGAVLQHPGDQTSLNLPPLGGASACGVHHNLQILDRYLVMMLCSGEISCGAGEV